MHDDPFRLEFVFNPLCDYSVFGHRASKGLSNSKMKSKTAHKRKAEKKARKIMRRGTR